MTSALTLSCGNDVGSSDGPPEQETATYTAPLSSQSTHPSTYRHPLQADIPNVDGVPLLDVVDDPNTGGRFVVGDELFVRSDGTVKQFSGVKTMHAGVPSPDEVDDEPRQRRIDTSPIISPELRTRMAALDGNETISVDIAVNRSADYVPIVHRMARAVAEGRITTNQERDQIRGTLVVEQQAQVASTLQPIVAHIRQIGGTVTSICDNMPCLDAELTSAQIETVASVPGVARMDPIFEAQINTVSGAAVSKGTQMTSASSTNEQFQDDGYLGEKSSYGLIRAGVLDLQRVDADHVGFNDSSSSSSRIASSRDCDGGSCYTAIWTNPANSHGTACAGLVLGDLTDDQDSNVTNANEQIRRSGYAREAELRFWRPEDGNDWDEALDDVVSYNDINVLSVSAGFASGDSNCTGTTTLSRDMNDIYEAGVLPIFAAGNQGHPSSSPSDCRVDGPGSAIGTFVVGGHINGWSTQYQWHVRHGDIYTSSSRGGTSSEGGGRTIIDITAPACRTLMFDDDGGYDFSACGTSFAAPTVAGGAVDFVDWYRDSLSSAIDDPGFLSANLLLMGDRADGYTSNITEGFDNVWGAGRFKMRKYGTGGMDGPWGFGTFSTCISDGEAWNHELNDGDAIGSDVDVIKAVAWWYDSRHENGTSIDDINLSLQYKSGSYWYNASGDYDDDDEKRRVSYENNSSNSYPFRLKFYGEDVTADSVDGCGSDSMKVYFAYMYEDSDRESHEDLDDIDTEF